MAQAFLSFLSMVFLRAIAQTLAAEAPESQSGSGQYYT